MRDHPPTIVATIVEGASAEAAIIVCATILTGMVVVIEPGLPPRGPVRPCRFPFTTDRRSVQLVGRIALQTFL